MASRDGKSTAQRFGQPDAFTPGHAISLSVPHNYCITVVRWHRLGSVVSAQVYHCNCGMAVSMAHAFL